MSAATFTQQAFVKKPERLFFELQVRAFTQPKLRFFELLVQTYGDSAPDLFGIRIRNWKWAIPWLRISRFLGRIPTVRIDLLPTRRCGGFLTSEGYRGSRGPAMAGQCGEHCLACSADKTASQQEPSPPQHPSPSRDGEFFLTQAPDCQKATGAQSPAVCAPIPADGLPHLPVP
jgi:hypothetical protein